jgi:hypothetical protein
MTHEKNKNIFRRTLLENSMRNKRITSIDDNIYEKKSIRIWFGESFFEVYVNTECELGMIYFYKPTKLERFITNIKWSTRYYIHKLQYFFTRRNR